MPTITFDVPDSIKAKIAGHEFTIDTTKIAPACLPLCFVYGVRRKLNDPAGSAHKAVRDEGGTWLASDSEAFITALYDGSLAEKAQRASGESTLDPIMVEARRLAIAEIVTRLGVKGWKECAAHEKGSKYIKVTEKGNLSVVTSAVDAYIERSNKALVAEKNDPEFTEPHQFNNSFWSRAHMIVGAREQTTRDIEL